FNAPWAWEIDRISIQWPSTIIVTSVASSHQRSEPGKPIVTARLNTNATLIASEMSVIIPGNRPRISPMAPLMNTQPPYAKTSVPKVAGIHRDAAGPPGAAYPNQSWTIGAQMIVGIDSTNAP